MAYNGWTNKETWLANLWLGDVLAEAQESGEEITPEYVENLVDEISYKSLDNDFLTDLLNCAFGEVNYQEIADHYRESV